MAAAVPPALWEAFHCAKDALLAALKTSVADAEAPSIAPRMRSETLDSIEASMDELSASLASMQKDISDLQACATKAIGRVRYALSPLGHLPLEVLERILDHAVVGPQDRRTIIRLTSVCDLWRHVVISLSHLFSSANWDTWPTEFLEIWCSRARESPLTIRIGTPGLLAIASPDGRLREKILELSKDSWESLSITTKDFPNRASEEDSRAIAPAMQHFLQMLFPDSPKKLKHLSLCLRYARGTKLGLKVMNAPALETVVWSTPHPLIILPELNRIRVCDIRPEYSTQLAEWFHSLHESSVADLRIDYGRFQGDIKGMEGQQRYSLASLKTITLRWLEDNEFRQTFGGASISGVESVTLQLKQRDWSVIMKMLVSNLLPLRALEGTPSNDDLFSPKK